MSSHSNKTLARRYAFQYLYSEEAEDNFNEEEFNESYRESDAENPNNDLSLSIVTLARPLLRKAKQNADQIEHSITPLLVKSSWGEIDRVERSILRLAMAEFLIGETPRKVILNEAINLAKSFGGKESSKFINAILDKAFA